MPTPPRVLDLAAATTVLEQLLAWEVEIIAARDTQIPAALGDIIDEAREVMGRGVVEGPVPPVDLKLVPGQCHTEILGALNRIADALEVIVPRLKITHRDGLDVDDLDLPPRIRG